MWFFKRKEERFPSWEELRALPLKDIKTWMHKALKVAAKVLESNPATSGPVERVKEAAKALEEPFSKEELLRLSPALLGTADLGHPKDDYALHHKLTEKQENHPVWDFLNNLETLTTNINHDKDTSLD